MPPKTQDEIKAELLARLNATADVVANLSAQLEDVEEKIAPAPAPFPENVSVEKLFFLSREGEARDKLFSALDMVNKAVQTMHKEAKNATHGVQHLRNGKAWGHVMEKASNLLYANFHAVEESMRAMADSAHLVATLATFARADVVPEDETLEGGAE
ncbi:MAG: hypothetical protein K6F46_09985 [Desulfovibrio sp.]|nr:hypothetical protein [Desulfovibrio sp.]